MKYNADPKIANNNSRQTMKVSRTATVKDEVESDDDDDETSGQTSFDLASNKPEVKFRAFFVCFFFFLKSKRKEDFFFYYKLFIDIDDLFCYRFYNYFLQQVSPILIQRQPIL